MALQKTEAFVLRTHPFRSSSLIVTTFSRAFGKVKGVAKGVRGEGIARTGTFESFTLLEMVFYEKLRSELHLISEATVLESFEGLRSNLETLATAYYLTELVDQLTEPHDLHEPIFELLHFAYQCLPFLSSSRVARFFEIRLLSEVGLLPHVTSCLGCGEEPSGKAFFSVKQGGVFCMNCRKKAPDSRPVSQEALKRMRDLQSEKATELIQASGGEREDQEIGQLIERFLSERITRKFSTRRFLNQVRSLVRKT